MMAANSQELTALLKQIDIEDLLPHAAPMALLSKGIYVDADRFTAEVVVAGNGLFDTLGKVPALVGIEYMAQTIAAWAGFHATQEGREVDPGLLLGIRSFDSSLEEFEVGQSLVVAVERVTESAEGLAVFNCETSPCAPEPEHSQLVQKNWKQSARLTVLTLDRAKLNTMTTRQDVVSDD